MAFVVLFYKSAKHNIIIGTYFWGSIPCDKEKTCTKQNDKLVIILVIDLIAFLKGKQAFFLNGRNRNFRLCVFASGSLIIVVFNSFILTKVSNLHLGQ